MRYVIALLFALHGIIHLMGFAKAFRLASVSQLHLQIGRLAGIAWLITCILMLVAAVYVVRWNPAWIYVGFVAVIMSQVLILLSWKDAWAGTVANAILLLAVIIGFAGIRFNEESKALIRQIQLSTTSEPPLIASIPDSLPKPVKRWLARSGIVGMPPVMERQLQQVGWMRLKPSDTKWVSTVAHQHFNYQEPAFIWTVDMKMFGVLPVKGRDQYFNARGRMQINVCSLIPVVRAADEKITEGSMQRFLAEICWNPGAALRPYISWTSVDNATAKAIMSYQGVSAEVLFSFDSAGHVTEVNAERYMGGGDKAMKHHWNVTCSGFRKTDGIPMKSVATWKLPEGDFSWYRFDVVDIN